MIPQEMPVRAERSECARQRSVERQRMTAVRRARGRYEKTIDVTRSDIKRSRRQRCGEGRSRTTCVSGKRHRSSDDMLSVGNRTQRTPLMPLRCRCRSPSPPLHAGED